MFLGLTTPAMSIILAFDVLWLPSQLCNYIIMDDAPGWVLGHRNPYSLVLHQTCPGGRENWKHGDTIGGKGCWNKFADEDF